MTTITRTEETRVPVEVEREESIATAVSRLLADTYATYLKTLYYHWNVTGPHFRSLHLMFEEQYVELQEAMDMIAERVRQLGASTPAFGKPLSSLTAVADDNDVPDAMQMVRNLVTAHEAVAVTARFVVAVATDKGDVATADIATERIEVHEKAIWMLRSTIE